MPRKPIAVEKGYAVGPGTVRLTVIVGDRQYGSSIVFLGDELIANDIRNKKTDMSVTWILTGGAKTLKIEKDATTAKGFGSQMFKAVFELRSDE
jgi:hypothetical protein